MSKILEHSKKILRLRKGEELLFWISGEGERVCGSADLAKNFVRIADFNNNFTGSVDPINVIDSGLGKKLCGLRIQSIIVAELRISRWLHRRIWH